MSEYQAIYIKNTDPSPCYVGMWRGLQDSTDGRTSIIDRSGKNKNLVLGADTSYAQFCSNAGYLTLTGSPPGANKAVSTPDVFTWDMFIGQSLIVAATIKAAAPGATAHIFNARGGTGDVKGFALVVDNLGRPVVFVRDTGTTFSTTAATDILTDSTDHQVICAVDGNSKKVYIWKDGVAVSNSGQTITATGGTTQGDGTAQWGAIGDFAGFAGGTWVNGANLLIKDMHALVMPYWPANIATIVAELVKNPHRPLSARLLPALVSA